MLLPKTPRFIARRRLTKAKLLLVTLVAAEVSWNSHPTKHFEAWYSSSQVHQIWAHESAGKNAVSINIQSYNIISIWAYMSYGRNYLFGENAITKMRGVRHRFCRLWIWIMGYQCLGVPIGYEGSLSRFKVQGNFWLLCSSTNFVGYSFVYWIISRHVHDTVSGKMHNDPVLHKDHTNKKTQQNGSTHSDLAKQKSEGCVPYYTWFWITQSGFIKIDHPKTTRKNNMFVHH